MNATGAAAVLAWGVAAPMAVLCASPAQPGFGLARGVELVRRNGPAAVGSVADHGTDRSVMTVPTPQPFDPLGPLPTGTTLLEASAGTGKTWTIGALVTRFVAEGSCRCRRCWW